MVIIQYAAEQSLDTASLFLQEKNEPVNYPGALVCMAGYMAL